MNAQKARRRSSATDRWNLWFTRGVQTAGLGIGLHEALLTQSDRMNVLAFAAAMVLGPQGLRLFVRGVRGLTSEDGDAS